MPKKETKIYMTPDEVKILFTKRFDTRIENIDLFTDGRAEITLPDEELQ